MIVLTVTLVVFLLVRVLPPMPLLLTKELDSAVVVGDFVPGNLLHQYHHHELRYLLPSSSKQK